MERLLALYRQFVLIDASYHCRAVTLWQPHALRPNNTAKPFSSAHGTSLPRLHDTTALQGKLAIRLSCNCLKLKKVDTFGSNTESEMKEKTKTRTWREYNEELGRYEWHEEETSKYVFEEEDKIAIAREYVERCCPASEIVDKYHISSAVVLYGWLDRYLNQKVGVSLQPESNIGNDMAKMTKQQLEEALKAAQAENKRLQEALELEKLRSRAFDTMIDVAEKNFNIPIRKKAGTKQ